MKCQCPRLTAAMKSSMEVPPNLPNLLAIAEAEWKERSSFVDITAALSYLHVVTLIMI